MAEGGKVTVRVIEETLERTKPGVSTLQLDQFAEKRILELGGEPGFKTVPNYNFATCININEGLVHGIPSEDKVLREGDIVSVDLGVFFKGFHTDAAWTVTAGQLDSEAARQQEEENPSEVATFRSRRRKNRSLKAATSKDAKPRQLSANEEFLEAGKSALQRATEQCVEGKFVGDISHAIQGTIEGAGFNVIRALVGHGVGRELHEAPQIPCFGEPKTGAGLKRGMTLAIEVLYAMGEPEIEVLEDGWTIRTKDESLSAIFEKTVLVGKEEPKVLTPIGWGDKIGA